jgi:hypothetical protein
MKPNGLLGAMEGNIIFRYLCLNICLAVVCSDIHTSQRQSYYNIYSILYFSNLQIPAFFRIYGEFGGKKTIFFDAKSDNLLFLTICYMCPEGKGHLKQIKNTFISAKKRIFLETMFKSSIFVGYHLQL